MNKIFKLMTAATVMILLTLVLTVGANAETEGIFEYSVSNGEARVTGLTDKSYSGALEIPKTLGGYPVTGIEGWAFGVCKGLTSITIPDSVTSIGDEAFIGCTSLESITFPDSVTSIGGTAFVNTAWYNNQPNGLVYAGKVAYIYKGTCPSSVTIKDGTLVIAAFYGCTSLESITIPDSVTKIDHHAFSGCTGLTSITIPDSVTSIDDSAFYGCTSLTSITIPDSVTSIGWGAFYGCTGLTSITIPDSVTSIGDSAFSGCDSLSINSVSGAYAEQYARQNSIPFVAINKPQSGDPTGETTPGNTTGETSSDPMATPTSGKVTEETESSGAVVFAPAIVAIIAAVAVVLTAAAVIAIKLIRSKKK